jgi:OOP family OmpA-OmpF porin
MFEISGKTKIAAMLAPVGLVASMSTGVAFAAEDMGFVSGKGDGVTTNYGECWTAKGGVDRIGECGEAPDSDGDGVPDDRDQCPNTPQGAAVDENGCPLDSDGDGVPDYKDQCPNTPAGAKVDANGCEIMASMTMQVTADHFAFDSAELKPAMMTALDDVAAQVAASKGDETLEIVGHTDSTGPAEYNQGLSERRAQSVADYLAGKGIPMSKMTVKGMGESSPVADNGTRDGRSQNRRVEILTN